MCPILDRRRVGRHAIRIGAVPGGLSGLAAALLGLIGDTLEAVGLRE